MARLDPVIERLFADAAERLVFESDSAGALVSAGAERPLYRQPLTTQQILGAFAEIVPPAQQALLGKDGELVFAYELPAGAVEVRLEQRGGIVRAQLQRAKGTVNTAREPMPAPAATPAAPPVATPAPPQVAVSTPRPGAIPVMLSANARQAMEQLLALMLEKRASDLHLSSNCTPMLRIDGDIVPVGHWGSLPPERLQAILWSIMPERNQAEWEERKDTDFAHETEEARFRVNVFADRQGPGAVLRTIPNKILTAEDMGLSQPILDLCHLSKGLVLVTGPTGSGKSTTLAAMIDYINRNRSDHIITIEDPIEFVHPNKRCLVNQREVGLHTKSFKNALRAALREDPDVVLVGELRDLETIAIAIETAETGHLVFGTLHTNTAASTVDRIIDQFPSDRQEQIRTMLAESLKGVIAQTLCKKIGGGRAAALEVLLCNSAVSNLIREGKTFQIPSIMQTSRNLGMVLLNDALLELVRAGKVKPAEALRRAVAKSELRSLLERNGFEIEEEAA